MVIKYLREFMLYRMLGNTEKADQAIVEIFKGLVDRGLIGEDLLNKDTLYAFLVNDYQGAILDDEDTEYLIEGIIDLAIMDNIMAEDEEESSQYIMVKYELNLEKGTKERYLIRYTFDSLFDVTDFLLFDLELPVLTLDSDEEKALGYNITMPREDLHKILLEQEEVALETVADNIPEGCEATMALVQTDVTKDKVVSAYIYAIYEVNKYQEITE